MTVNEEEDKKAISFSDFFVRLWRLLSPSHKLIRGIVAVITLAALLDIVKPYMVKLIIDRLTVFKPEDILIITQFIIAFLLSDQIRSVVQYYINIKILKLVVELEYYLALKAQNKLIYLPLGYHEKENTGNKIVKIERGINRISSLVDSIGWELLPTIVQLVFSVVVLFWSDWRLGTSILFFVPISIYLTYHDNKKMYPVRKNIFKDYENASGKMTQSIININAVQSFSQEDFEINSFDQIKSQIRKNELWQWVKMMRSGLGRNIISDLGNSFILALGAYLVYQQSISIGTLVFAFSMSTSTYNSLYRLSRIYDRMEEGKEGVKRLMELLEAESDLEVRENTITPVDIKGDLEFEMVNFSYQENTRLALDNVSFKIEAGQMVALVGPSGGGKTTIARLLYRHYDPSQGAVKIDNVDLRDYSLQGFRKFLAIVPQEVEIFDFSVRENIAYARPDASVAEIEAAAKVANAHDFILKLDKGYDTLVGERGVKLSGGQRQRIGIARAILANPRILIFDEATSNLDSESESLIQNAMEKISRDRTFIVIAHRLSTITKADKIIVLENGQLAEEGSHDTLAKKEGVYKRLLKLQQLGEIK